jgi:hypothetical protein
MAVAIVFGIFGALSVGVAMHERDGGITFFIAVLGIAVFLLGVVLTGIFRFSRLSVRLLKALRVFFRNSGQ